MIKVILVKHIIYKVYLFVVLLMPFSVISQESLTVVMKQDTIIINDSNASTNIDSTKNSDIRSYNITKNGDSLQLISIDNSKSTKKLYSWALFGIILLIAGIIGLSIYYFFKRKKGSSKNRLTKQELNIVRLINSDKTNLQIAEELCISMSTVKTHVNNIYRKLNISSRKELKTNLNYF